MLQPNRYYSTSAGRLELHFSQRRGLLPAISFCCRIIQSSQKTGEFLAYDDLRAWIAALERAGELKTVRTEVDPILEIAEITDRVSKSPPTLQQAKGGPALLFQNIKGHPGSQLL